MQKKIFVTGIVALAATMTASHLMMAAPGDKKGNKGQGKNGPAQAQIKRIEEVLGKPLTAEQKTAIEEAQKTYMESVAKALGMTVDEWMAKQKEYRQAHPPAQKAAPPAKAGA